ncbi:hypothetical protein HN615_14005 [Candidatus Woesearchaeota archaeon]|nr:hypothetical protein [Candidatus Woesearchaeota archaeon]
MDIEEIIRQLEESIELEEWSMVEMVLEKIREEGADNPFDDYSEEDIWGT